MRKIGAESGFRFLWSLGFVVMLILGPVRATRAQAPFAYPLEGERARATLVRGEVKCRAGEEQPWSALPLGAFVQAGDHLLLMQEARLELQLPDGSVVRFDEGTRVRLVSAAYEPEKGGRDVKFFMALGKTWANIRQVFGSRAGVQVEADNAVVGIRGTVFRMNVAEDKSALVRVYRGSVKVRRPARIGAPTEAESEVHRVPGPSRVAGPHRVTMKEWVRIVEAMQQITVSPEGIPSDPRRFTPEEDLNEWVEWNQERDRRL